MVEFGRSAAASVRKLVIAALPPQTPTLRSELDAGWRWS